MNLDQVEVFLVLSQELHFGRTAERLHLTQSRVSRLLASLEREVGGSLFERTSRRVRLTPLGVRLRDRLAPAHTALLAALDDAKRLARGTKGVLRLGFTVTTEEPVFLLVDAFESQYEDCRVELSGVNAIDPYGALRRDEVDVLVNWLVVDEPDLTVGPAIKWMERVLAVSTRHPLAERTSISIEELTDHEVGSRPPNFPAALFEALVPTHTPSGIPIPRSTRHSIREIHEHAARIARGEIVHPTVAVQPFRGHDSIVLIPIHDLAPIPVGLIWRTAHENARIRALAKVAAGLNREPTQPNATTRKPRALQPTSLSTFDSTQRGAAGPRTQAPRPKA